MTERAAHLVDEVLPRVPVRQWVLTVPYRLRYQMAWDHALSRAVLGVYALVLLDVYARCPRAPYPRRSDGHGHGNSALGKRPESERTGRADFHRVVMPLRPGTPRARVSGPLAFLCYPAPRSCHHVRPHVPSHDLSHHGHGHNLPGQCPSTAVVAADPRVHRASSDSRRIRPDRESGAGGR